MFSGSDRPCNSRDSAAPVPKTRGVVGTSRPRCLTEQPGLAAPRHGRQRGPMADHATGRTPSVGAAGADPRRGRRGTPAGRLRRPPLLSPRTRLLGVTPPRIPRKGEERPPPPVLLAFVHLELASGVFDGKARDLPPETYPPRSASDASRARASVRRRGPWAAGCSQAPVC